MPLGQEDFIPIIPIVPILKTKTTVSFFFFPFFKDFIYLFLEKRREGEREGEKQQCVVASHALPSGDPACNPGMCPDWESNQKPFGSQASTQSTEPHQAGLDLKF